MFESKFWGVFIEASSASFVLLLTFPALQNFASLLSLYFRRAYRNTIFENEDGVALEESQQKFSGSLYARAVLLTASVSGAALSLVLAIVEPLYDVVQYHDDVSVWIQFLCWVFLALQTIRIALEKDSVKRFGFALNAAFSCGILILATCLQTNWWALDPTKLYFQIARTVLLLVDFVSCLLLPQHPEIYWNGNPVDGQWRGSIINRLSYSWVTQLLALAGSQKRIEVEDLPEMDHHTRVRQLYDTFNSKNRPGRLARILIISHAPAIIRVYILTIFTSALDFAPQFAIFNLLRLLEARQSGVIVDEAAIVWAAGLGLIMGLKCVIENWMWWVARNHIHTPIRVQLSALIFAKAMRLKEVKGTQDSEQESERSSEGGMSNGQEESITDQAGEPDQPMKTRQGTINLVAVDAKRIAEFCISQNQYLGVLGKIVVSFTFLNQLIGWQALLAGILVQLLTIPLNVYFAKKYTNVQGQVMKIRDTKLSVVNEALMGIRQVKFSALEGPWYSKIMKIRGQELDLQYQAFLANTIIVFCWLAGPVLLSAVSIGVYAVLHQSLSASIAFTTISILNTVQTTLAWIPQLTTSGIDAWISLGRIEKYLKAPEKLDNTTPGNEISFQNATISWPSDADLAEGAFAIKDMNLSLPNRELTIVSGPTGSGKSLFLAAILDEVEIRTGSITVPIPNPLDNLNQNRNASNWIIPSAKAFVSQQPWIENCSLKDNVLFGLLYDEERYRKVLFACALEEDLKIMPDGDRTEIGVSGINLSGGQRWRLTLARAIYSRAEILVIDDVFSAVDALVGRHILEHAICGELGQRRTRILVTHHVSLFSTHRHYSVQLGEAGVCYVGYVDVIRRDGKPKDILDEEKVHIAKYDDLLNPYSTSTDLSEYVTLSALTTEDLLSGTSTPHVEGEVYPRPQSILTSRASSDTIHYTNSSSNAKDGPRKFVEDETKLSGNVSWSVYLRYCKSVGGVGLWAGILSIFCVYEAAVLFTSWWVALWTQSYSPVHLLVQFVIPHHLHQTVTTYPVTTYPVIRLQEIDTNLQLYLGVYFGLSLLIAVLAALRYLWIFQGSISASRRLFGKFTYALLHAPLRWLDTVPLGRIQNRFTADFGTIDSEIGLAIATVLNFVLRILGIVVAGTITSPYMLVIAVVLLAASGFTASYYLQGAREMKRLENLARSHIFDLFGASLEGLNTIRAWGRSDVYVNNMFIKIDAHCRTIWYMWAFNTWLTFRLGIIGTVFSTAMAILVVLLKNVTAPIAGFALIFTLDYTDAVMWALRYYAEIELGMCAMERVLEYSEIAIEDQGGTMPPAAWPTEGALVVSDLVVSYALDLPPVLNGVSFSVQPKERIGVIGRTGAGKSSLALAIFRFLEARQGSILIDGLDISTLSLHYLRSRLAIIPQDPVLSSGNIRSNLDPFDSHSDDEILEALRCVHLIHSSESESPSSVASSITDELASPNSSRFTSLQTPVSEGGHNLSQGQRQLLCLARAILSRPKMLILDEASSAVDKETDTFIQRSIREEFFDSTLIVIAHRLNTVIDFDKILVMGEGRVLEFGAPKDLAEAGGTFAGMLKESGICFGDH